MDVITSQLSALVESSAKPDVVVLALPVPLIEKLVNAKSEEHAEGAEDEDDGNDMLNFRDLLKAKTLYLSVPTQIVWPDTWDDAKIPRKVKRDSNRQTQVKATLALRELAVAASKLTLESGLKSDGSRMIEIEAAIVRLNLSGRLTAIGERAQALEHAQMSVDVLRKLDPVPSKDLSRALATLSSCLDETGRYREGLAAIEESVRLREACLDPSDAQTVAALARGLGLLAASFHSLGERPKALTAAEAAADWIRKLAVRS